MKSNKNKAPSVTQRLDFNNCRKSNQESMKSLQTTWLDTSHNGRTFNESGMMTASHGRLSTILKSINSVTPMSRARSRHV